MHLEYIYVNVLYISEAHRWSDEHIGLATVTIYGYDRTLYV